MKKTTLAATLGLSILLLIAISALPLRVAHAQCGLPGYPKCDGGGGGEKEKKATPTDTRQAPTATVTLVYVPQSGGEGGTLMPLDPSTATVDPYIATADMCDEYVLQTPVAQRTPSGPDFPPFPQCHPTRTATPATPIVLPPNGNPVFVPPGVKNAFILVLIIGILLGSGFLILRPRAKK